MRKLESMPVTDCCRTPITERASRLGRAEKMHHSIACLGDALDSLENIESSLWACDLTYKDETLVKAKLLEIRDILTPIRENRLLTGRR